MCLRMHGLCCAPNHGAIVWYAAEGHLESCAFCSMAMQNKGLCTQEWGAPWSPFVHAAVNESGGAQGANTDILGE